MNCRVFWRNGFDRCRYFDISSDAFRLFITSDQTYCRGSRRCVPANCGRWIFERFDTRFDI